MTSLIKAAFGFVMVALGFLAATIIIFGPCLVCATLGWHLLHAPPDTLGQPTVDIVGTVIAPFIGACIGWCVGIVFGYYLWHLFQRRCNRPLHFDNMQFNEVPRHEL